MGKLDMTFDFTIYTYWNQGEPGKSLSEVHTDLPSVLQTSDRPSVKVIQIPLEIPSLSPSLYAPCCLNPEVAYGFIAFDGRFIGYLLRKEDALALDRMVLELERSQCISPSFMMWMETKPRWKLPETFIGDFPSACL